MSAYYEYCCKVLVSRQVYRISYLVETPRLLKLNEWFDCLKDQKLNLAKILEFESLEVLCLRQQATPETVENTHEWRSK